MNRFTIASEFNRNFDEQFYKNLFCYAWEEFCCYAQTNTHIPRFGCKIKTNIIFGYSFWFVELMFKFKHRTEPLLSCWSQETDNKFLSTCCLCVCSMDGRYLISVYKTIICVDSFLCSNWVVEEKIFLVVEKKRKPSKRATNRLWKRSYMPHKSTICINKVMMSFGFYAPICELWTVVETNCCSFFLFFSSLRDNWRKKNIIFTFAVLHLKYWHCQTNTLLASCAKTLDRIAFTMNIGKWDKHAQLKMWAYDQQRSYACWRYHKTFTHFTMKAHMRTEAFPSNTKIQIY